MLISILKLKKRTLQWNIRVNVAFFGLEMVLLSNYLMSKFKHLLVSITCLGGLLYLPKSALGPGSTVRPLISPESIEELNKQSSLSCDRNTRPGPYPLLIFW